MCEKNLKIIFFILVKVTFSADSGDEEDEDKIPFNGDIVYKYESSEYSSSEEENESHRLSPIPDDANSKNYSIKISLLTPLKCHFIRILLQYS